MDLICLTCGEPWDIDTVLHEMPEDFERGVDPLNGEADGKILMLGCDYKSSTFIHLAETMDWNNRLKADDQVRYRYTNREVVGEMWDATNNPARGKVGDADSRLFGIRPFVDTVLGWIETCPEKVFTT